MQNLVSGVVGTLVSFVVGAAEPVDSHPELTRLSPKQAVWVNAQSRQLVVGGAVALADGPIEFFACPRKTKSTNQLSQSTPQPNSYTPAYSQLVFVRVAQPLFTPSSNQPPETR